MAKSKKKFDDSVNDKAKPKINNQSQIETGWMVPRWQRQVRGEYEQVENIADNDGNKGFPKVRLEHLVRMRLNAKTAKGETAKRNRGSARISADQNSV